MCGLCSIIRNGRNVNYVGCPCVWDSEWIRGGGRGLLLSLGAARLSKSLRREICQSCVSYYCAVREVGSDLLVLVCVRCVRVGN